MNWSGGVTEQVLELGFTQHTLLPSPELQDLGSTVECGSSERPRFWWGVLGLG